ncbi:hypothetical protein GmHk_09G026787 [Glycine max]|nr:hypothetical protein GmHk_09G026787 [Glycine max]
MAPPPGPYSGTSTLALVRSQLPFLVSFFLFSRGTHTIHSQVARASAFSFGLVYGTIKLKYLKLELEAMKHGRRTRHGRRTHGHLSYRVSVSGAGKSQISSKSSGEGSSLKAMRDPRCYYLSIDGVEY